MKNASQEPNSLDIGTDTSNSDRSAREWLWKNIPGRADLVPLFPFSENETRKSGDLMDAIILLHCLILSSTLISTNKFEFILFILIVFDLSCYFGRKLHFKNALELDKAFYDTVKSGEIEDLYLVARFKPYREHVELAAGIAKRSIEQRARRETALADKERP